MRRFALIALAGSLACDSPSAEQTPRDTEAAIKTAVATALKDNNKTVATAHASLTASHTALQAQLTANAEQLAALGTQLDALDGKLAKTAVPAPTPPPPTPAGPKPGRPDPAVTYKVALGDAQTQGSKTALVTIVEWSDFQ